MIFRSIALLWLLSPFVTAQVTLDMGPNPAPLGSTVYASITNDTDSILGLFGNDWEIRDATGSLVFAPTGFNTSYIIGSLGTFNYQWNQRDQSGQQVAPGMYQFVVFTPLGTQEILDLQVGGVDANLFVRGTAAIGSDQIGFGGRDIVVAAPGDAGKMYAVYISGGLGVGTGRCGAILPIQVDSLFQTAIARQLIPASVGVLDSEGQTLAPKLPIPDRPELVGLELHLAAVTFERSPGSGGCSVLNVTPAFSTTIVAGAP